MATIRIEWAPPTRAVDEFLVYRAPSAVELDDQVAPLATVPADETSYEDTQVEPPNRYFYRVTAVLGDWEMDSVAVEGVLQPPPPAALIQSYKGDLSPPIFRALSLSGGGVLLI